MTLWFFLPNLWPVIQNQSWKWPLRGHKLSTKVKIECPDYWPLTLDLWLNKHYNVKNRVIFSCSEWIFDLWSFSYDNSGSEGVLLSMEFIWLQSPLRESLHLELDTVLKFQAENLNFKECIILPIELAKAGPICVSKFQQMATQEAKVQNFYANCLEVNGNLWILRYFSREVASDFLFLCRHLFGISKRGLVQFGPTQGWVWYTPYFSSSPPRFWVLGFAASVYFLLVETVVDLANLWSSSI